MTVMVIFLTLILSGRLHTDAEFRRTEAALDKEKEAHDETRRALTAASERADAAIRASEVIADAFTYANRRKRYAQETPGQERRGSA